MVEAHSHIYYSDEILSSVSRIISSRSRYHRDATDEIPPTMIIDDPTIAYAAEDNSVDYSVFQLCVSLI